MHFRQTIAERGAVPQLCHGIKLNHHHGLDVAATLKLFSLVLQSLGRQVVRYDYSCRLTRKDGSAGYFHIYGRTVPNYGDIVTIPVDGELVEAKITTRNGHTPPRLEMLHEIDVTAAEI